MKGEFMAKGQNQKAKLLYLAKIFAKDTDENHGISMREIINKLKDLQINADRKTLYSDFQELSNFGLDIDHEKRGSIYYYKLVNRDFELPELKLLVDAVQSSKFITEKKSRTLIKKLENLVSNYDAKELHHQVLIAGRVKTMNESIYYNVDYINNAINQDKKIKFKYFHWNVKKEKDYRDNKEWYYISPWRLRWDDENYYLIGYDKETKSIKHYRVDKMEKIHPLSDTREGKEVMKTLDPALYTKCLFGMYSGEIVNTKLEGENSAVGILIDRFGKDIPITPIDDNHFSSHVDVAISPQFFGWIASLGGQIRITGPKNVVKDMKEFIEKINGQY
jgi:predicted DNA-binding transcriptional regulator YafY